MPACRAPFVVGMPGPCMRTCECPAAVAITPCKDGAPLAPPWTDRARSVRSATRRLRRTSTPVRTAGRSRRARASPGRPDRRRRRAARGRRARRRSWRRSARPSPTAARAVADVRRRLRAAAAGAEVLRSGSSPRRSSSGRRPPRWPTTRPARSRRSGRDGLHVGGAHSRREHRAGAAANANGGMGSRTPGMQSANSSATTFTSRGGQPERGGFGRLRAAAARSGPRPKRAPR